MSLGAVIRELDNNVVIPNRATQTPDATPENVIAPDAMSIGT